MSAQSDETEERKVHKQTCFHGLVRKLRLTEEGATPPNWKYIFLSFVSLFSSASSLTFLFPFLPEMMLHFGYSENEKGTYAGLVASSVFAGRIFGSVFWGYLADRFGRKIVLLITIALNGTFAGLFGFSRNIIMAIVFRFLCGASNGTVGTAKAVLYDISDNSNQALGMSILSIAWGTGLMVGPAVGGLLADPARKWPGVFTQDSLFRQYPYLLPSLFPFIACVIIFFIIFWKFDDTFVGTIRNRCSQTITIQEECHESNDAENAEMETAELDPPHSHDLLTCIGHSLKSLNEDLETSAILAQEELKNSRIDALKHRKKWQSQQMQFVSVPDLINPESSVTNSLTCHLSKSTSHVNKNSPAYVKFSDGSELPQTEDAKVAINLQVMSGPNVYENGSKKLNCNGNGFYRHDEDEEIEICLIPNQEPGKVVEEEERVCECVESCCQTRCCLPYQNTSLYRLLRLVNVWSSVVLYGELSFIIIGIDDIFPVFASTKIDYGGLGFSTDEIGLALGAMVLPLLFLQVKLYPFLVSKMGIRKVFLVGSIACMITSQAIPLVRLFNSSPIWLWVSLMAIQIPFKIATNCCFAGTALLINNSVTPDLAGQANGLGMMVSAICRTIAPTVAGVLFSWSVTYGPEIGPPFDTSFPFFVIGCVFFIAVVHCLHLDPRLDQQRK